MRLSIDDKYPRFFFLINYEIYIFEIYSKKRAVLFIIITTK